MMSISKKFSFTGNNEEH